MEDKNFEVNVPGEFSDTEEAILGYLYAHPDGNIGTKDLMSILKAAQSTIEQKQQAYEETQHGIETLIVARLVKGKRVSESGNVGARRRAWDLGGPDFSPKVSMLE